VKLLDKLTSIAFPQPQERRILSLLMLGFTDEELHLMFMQFYFQFDTDESLSMDFKEVCNCLERFTLELGVDTMLEIIKCAGVEHQKGFLANFKEEYTFGFSLPVHLYNDFFDRIAQQNKVFVPFDNFFPYLFTFFLHNIYKGVIERRDFMEEIRGEYN